MSKKKNLLNCAYNQRTSENELHDLFDRLAELVDTVATSRHIEVMEAYNIIDRIINYYQQS